MGKAHSKHPHRRRSPEGACHNVCDVIVTSSNDVGKQKCYDDVIGDVDSTALLSSRLIESVKLNDHQSTVTNSCPRSRQFVFELPQNTATSCNVSTVNRLSTVSPISSSCSTTDDNNGSPDLKYLRDESTAASPSVERCLVATDSCNNSNSNEWALTLYNCDGQETVTDEDVTQLLQHLRSALTASISQPRNSSSQSAAGKAQVVRLRLTVSPPESVLDVPSPSHRSTTHRAASQAPPSSLNVRPSVPDVVLPAGRLGKSAGQNARSGCATTTTTTTENSPMMFSAHEHNLADNFSRLNDFGSLSCRDWKTVCEKLEAKSGMAGDDGEVEDVFDERSLAELVRRNMDMNVRTASRYKSRNQSCRSYSQRNTTTSSSPVDKSPRMFTSQLSSPYHVNSVVENSTFPSSTLQPSCLPPFSDTRQQNHCVPSLRRCQKHVRVTSTPPLLTSSPIMPRSAENCRQPVLEKSWKKTIPELPETISMSHYYQRHRHRERNQCRAMRQVAEWIKDQVPDAAVTTGSAEIDESDAAGVGVVRRHEHHHVHEHIHRHYHYCIGANDTTAAAAAAAAAGDTSGIKDS